MPDAAGNFPRLFDVFKDFLRLSNGETLETQGNYDDNFFLIRLSVPKDAQGPFEIHIEDSAGMVALFHLNG